jgi:hypothetical protein
MESTQKSRIPKQAIEDEIFWQHHMAAQAASGLSKSAYCHLNQVDYGRFIYWSRKAATANSDSSLVAVKLRSTQEELGSVPLLCTLMLKKGGDLRIHDAGVLPLILERLS